MILLDLFHLRLFCDSVQWVLFSCASSQCLKGIWAVWKKPWNRKKYSLLLLTVLLVISWLCEPFCIYFLWDSYFEKYFDKILEKQNFIFPLLGCWTMPTFLAFLHKRGASALWSSSWPPLDTLQLVQVFLELRTPELDAVLQAGSHEGRVAGKNHLSWTLATPSF